MKYTNAEVTFREFPDEISLCINISGCKFKCDGCHSPELWEDIGTKLTFTELHKLITHNKGITCIGFMGGDPEEVNALAEYVKNVDPPLKVGWYWGGIKIPTTIITTIPKVPTTFSLATNPVKVATAAFQFPNPSGLNITATNFPKYANILLSISTLPNPLLLNP